MLIILRASPVSIINQFSTSIFILVYLLFLSEGQAVEAWEPEKKNSLVNIFGHEKDFALAL